MPKKILFFISITNIGGAETNVAKIGFELYKLGYEIHFLVVEDNGHFFNLVNHYATTCNVLFYPLHHPINLIKSIYKYKKIIQKNKIDVVFNFGLKVEIFSIIFSKLIKSSIKIISNIRNTDKLKPVLYKITYVFFTFFANKICSNSIAGKKMYQINFLGLKNKIQVIYNYIEISDINIEIKKSNPSIIYIGVLANIIKKKGHFDLIPIAKKLINNNINPIFLCGGIDYTAGLFEKKINENNLQHNFKLLGYLENKKAYFEQLDIFLLPSYYEGMPTVVLEAMAHKKPIITTNVDGMLEQIKDGENGLLVTPGDIDGFVGAILNLIHNNSLKEKFITNSIQVLEQKFRKKDKIEDWVNVIEN